MSSEKNKDFLEKYFCWILNVSNYVFEIMFSFIGRMKWLNDSVFVGGTL